MHPSSLQSWLTDPSRQPLVMGILNVTPDSFSDGGRLQTPDAAVEHARMMALSGADWIDIGGESTRPGSVRVPADEQLRRIMPVIRRVVPELSEIVFSIDTTLSEVAAAAIDAGIHVINDISAGRDDPEMLPLVAARGVPAVLMHMQGAPQTMQLAPAYGDVVAEVGAFLAERLATAEELHIPREHILLDPGIGFGKSLAHNLELLRQLPRLAALGRPMVVGTSRKSFLAKVTGESDPGRPYSTAASVAWSVANGASVVRVHEVGSMSQVVRMVRAIQHAGEPPNFAAAGGGASLSPV